MKKKIIRFLVFSIIIVKGNVACKWDEEPVKLPDESRFESETTLMLNICRKFSEELDAKKLHAAAVGTQATRVIDCVDYQNECTLYNHFITAVINSTSSGSLSSEDRIALLNQLRDLRESIESGKRHLHVEWQKRHMQD